MIEKVNQKMKEMRKEPVRKKMKQMKYQKVKESMIHKTKERDNQNQKC